MNCLLLILALTVCEPGEEYLTRQYVDYSVWLYFREYVFSGKEITTTYQLAGTDLADDLIETLPMPFMITVNRKPYLVACVRSKCWMQPY